MKKVEILVNGKAYPCRPSMGAMLRFKRETGREITEIGQGSLSDICTYLWCCVASACKHDGIDFNMKLMDFADSISTEDMSEWANTMQSEHVDEDSGEEKKAIRH